MLSKFSQGHSLSWGSLEANPETRIQMDVVCLGCDPRNTGREWEVRQGREGGQERVHDGAGEDLEQVWSVCLRVQPRDSKAWEMWSGH